MFIYLFIYSAVLQQEIASYNLEEQNYNSDIQRKNILAPVSGKVYPARNSMSLANNETAIAKYFNDTSQPKGIENEMLVYQII